MKLRIFILIAFSLCSISLWAGGKNSQPPQTDSLYAYEQKLKILGDSVVDGRMQATRVIAIKKFIPLFVKALKFRGSFEYPFDSLKFMKILQPEDHSFRLYNWVLKYNDGTYRYYGAIQLNRPDSLKLIPLRDYTDELDTNLEQLVVGPDQWIGALYYRIIPHKIKRKTYYTLLGWQGANYATDHKVIDVLSFEKDKPEFGAPIFLHDNKTKDRVIFTFKGDVTMYMDFVPEHDMITLDHMVPPNAASTGFLQTYVPDGTYDYMVFEKNHWVFHEEDVFEHYKKPIKGAGDQKFEDPKKNSRFNNKN